MLHHVWFWVALGIEPRLSYGQAGTLPTDLHVQPAVPSSLASTRVLLYSKCLVSEPQRWACTTQDTHDLAAVEDQSYAAIQSPPTATDL